MATLVQGTRKRLEVVEEARQAAARGDWESAVALNQRLIEQFSPGVEEYNRLGKALTELGRYEEARQPYAAALRLDPLNAIAARNLERLEELAHGAPAPPAPAGRLDPAFFLEEPGRTALTRILLSATPEQLAGVAAGDPVELQVAEGEVRVSVRGVPLGHLEPNLALRLISLGRAGNRYRAGVESAAEGDLILLVREVERAPGLASRPSFPPAAGEVVQEAGGPYISELEGIEATDLDGYLEKYDEYEEPLAEEERAERREERLEAVEAEADLQLDEGVELRDAEDLEELERQEELGEEEELERY